MNLPPGHERRAVPRHIRDGEHDGWQDAGDAPPGSRPFRRRVAWLSLLAMTALVAGLWFWLAPR